MNQLKGRRERLTALTLLFGFLPTLASLQAQKTPTPLRAGQKNSLAFAGQPPRGIGARQIKGLIFEDIGAVSRVVVMGPDTNLAYRIETGGEVLPTELCRIYFDGLPVPGTVVPIPDHVDGDHCRPWLAHIFVLAFGTAGESAGSAYLCDYNDRVDEPCCRLWGDCSGSGGRSYSYLGQWKTDFGAMTFENRGGSRIGASYDSGTVLLDVNGIRAQGRWFQDSSGQRCSSKAGGTNYWGGLWLQTDSSSRRFNGKWSYCESTQTSGDWNGTRVSESSGAAARPEDPGSSPGSCTVQRGHSSGGNHPTVYLLWKKDGGDELYRIVDAAGPRMIQSWGGWWAEATVIKTFSDREAAEAAANARCRG